MKRTLPVTIKRIVIKVGTGILTGKNYRLNKTWIKGLVGQIAALNKQNIEVVLVSSGAIGAGMGMLKLAARPRLLPAQQATAAVGQGQLMKTYDTFFKQHGLLTAQILLTGDDLSSRKRYLNAKNTIFTLLSFRVIPIINENDTVSVDEIKFGDNDKLSALVAGLVQADLLVILSDVDGLYDQTCGVKKGFFEKPVISVIDRICPDIEKMAAKGKSSLGTGGMKSKIAAAKICCSAGIACIIANGKTQDVLHKIINAEDIGSLFLSNPERLESRKRWIGFSAKIKGQIYVDSGAKQALIEKKKSLLPKGIIKLNGFFLVGDSVSLLDLQNHEFARGLTNYSSEELAKIKGLNSDQIKGMLGYKGYDEAVHRDNLVIL